MATSSSILTQRPSSLWCSFCNCCCRCCCFLVAGQLSKRRSHCIELTEHCGSNAADLTDGSMFLPAAASPRIPDCAQATATPVNDSIKPIQCGTDRRISFLYRLHGPSVCLFSRPFTLKRIQDPFYSRFIWDFVIIGGLSNKSSSIAMSAEILKTCRRCWIRC